MVTVTETYPGTLLTYNAKQDVQAVPVGDEDKWLDSGDVNDITNPLIALQRAVRLNALVASITGTSEVINGKAFKYTGTLASGLPVATAVLTTELDKLFAAAVEKIEEGGDTDGTASNTALFGLYNGIVSGTTGQFTTGTLLGLSAGGGLVTYTSGALPPIGIGRSTSTAYVDVGGRIRADATTVQFNSSGQLEVMAPSEYNDGGEAKGKDRILGNTDNFDLSFITNNIVRQHIEGGGNIGIGPAFTSPTELLHLNQNQNGQTALRIENANAGATAASDLVLIETGSQFFFFRYRNSGGDGSVLTAIANSGVVGSGSGATGGLILGTAAAAPIRFYTGGEALTNEKMRIENSGDVVIGATSASAQLHVDQPSVTGAQPVLFLDQADVSEEMIEFATTIGVGNAIEAVGAKTLTTTHFIKVTLPGALTRYFPVGTIA